MMDFAQWILYYDLLVALLKQWGIVLPIIPPIGNLTPAQMQEVAVHLAAMHGASKLTNA